MDSAITDSLWLCRSYFPTNMFSFWHGAQSHKSAELAICSVVPEPPNFQSAPEIRDEFLMETMSCLLASTSLHLIYCTHSSVLRVETARLPSHTKSLLLADWHATHTFILLPDCAFDTGCSVCLHHWSCRIWVSTYYTSHAGHRSPTVLPRIISRR